MLNRNRHAMTATGFTLVELMVAVAVLGIVTAVAMPSFNTWMRNIEIRNAAESVTSGLQRARAEAVARNTNVTFVLGTGTSWTVSVVSPAATIASRSSSDGSRNTTVTATPDSATTITFNNLGIVAANADGSASLTQLDFAATGASVPLRVTISSSGSARSCDPALTSGSSPRAC